MARTYVGLLRGINVGGKTKVEMAALREAVGAAGFSEVRTYINSGNVIFGSEDPADGLEARLERVITESFGLEVPVLIRDAPAIERLCRAIPSAWTNDSEQRTDVVFLRAHIDAPDLMDRIDHDSTFENVLHAEGALVWNLRRADATRSNLRKLVGSSLYPHLSIRNINTVRKLHALMSERAD